MLRKGFANYDHNLYYWIKEVYSPAEIMKKYP